MNKDQFAYLNETIIDLESQLSSAQIEARRFEGEWQECKKELAEAKAEINLLKSQYADREQWWIDTRNGLEDKLEKLEAVRAAAEYEGLDRMFSSYPKTCEALAAAKKV